MDIQELHRLQRAGQSTTRIASQIDRELARLNTGLETLTRTLASQPLAASVRTQRERMIADSANALERLKASAMGQESGIGLMGSRGTGAREPVARPEVDNMLMQQQQQLKEQDASLDLLLASVTRQKEMGEAISEELDVQSGLLDDLEDGMDNTKLTVSRQQGRVEGYMEQAKNSGNTCIILGLSTLLIILTMLALDMI